MDDQIEPRRSPRPRRQSAVIEALGENTSTAQNSIAAETARHDHQAEPAAPPAADRRGAADIGYGSAWNWLRHPGQKLVPLVGRTVITVVAPSQNGALHIKPARDQGRRT